MLSNIRTAAPVRRLRFALSFVSLVPVALASGMVNAQTEPSESEVRDALAKQEGEGGSTEALQETLTATDKSYSLLRANRFAATYDFTYSYISEQLIEADFTEQDLTNFNIQNTQGHTLRNTVSLDYGILDNLTANVTVPFVSKYSDTDNIDGDAHSIGDVAVGARFQPFPIQRNWPVFTVSATATFPTGRGPFETSQQELASGSGYAGYTLGFNASKVIDPVALFGSVSFTYNTEQDDIDYVQDDFRVTNSAPGSGMGWGLGFAYALSYDITTTMSFQQYLQDSTELTIVNAEGIEDKRNTGKQTSAAVNLGLGVRLQATTLNFSIGIGLTSDAPDFSFGVNIPLRF